MARVVVREMERARGGQVGPGDQLFGVGSVRRETSVRVLSGDN